MYTYLGSVVFSWETFAFLPGLSGVASAERTF
jgi:hypothetical protein